MEINYNKIDRQPITRKEAWERGWYFEPLIEANENDIVGVDCLACGYFTIIRIEDKCSCGGKECPHV